MNLYQISAQNNFQEQTYCLQNSDQNYAMLVISFRNSAISFQNFQLVLIQQIRIKYKFNYIFLLMYKSQKHEKITEEVQQYVYCFFLTKYEADISQKLLQVAKRKVTNKNIDWSSIQLEIEGYKSNPEFKMKVYRVFFVQKKKIKVLLKKKHSLEEKYTHSQQSFLYDIDKIHHQLLYCKFCNQLAKQAMRLTCDGQQPHMFLLCKVCFEIYSQGSRECLFCYEQFIAEEAYPQRRAIDEVFVICWQGCYEMFKLVNLQLHQKVCSKQINKKEQTASKNRPIRSKQQTKTMQQTSSLVCPICIQMFDKVVECLNCKAIYCYKCANNYLQAKSEILKQSNPNEQLIPKCCICPQPFLFKESTILRKLISQKIIPCPNKCKQGKLKYSQIKQHLDFCDKKQSQCMFCKKQMKRQQLFEHTLQNHRKDLDEQIIQRHKQQEVWGQYESSCLKCNKFLKTEQLFEHILEKHQDYLIQNLDGE